MVLYFFDFAEEEKREEERGKSLVVDLCFLYLRVVGVVEELFVVFIVFH